MDTKIVNWVCGELSRLLGTEATEDFARYLLSIESSNDLREYMNELLDSGMPQNKHFISELLKKWQQLHSNDHDDDDDTSKALHQLPAAPISCDLPKNSKKGKKKSIENKSPNVSENSNNTTPGSSGKKTNFVPLFSNEGQQRTVAMLPGRHRCDCQAAKHTLVSNCLSCGRIVCQQEGPGPCLFCGHLVCNKEQQEILAHNSKKSEKLRNHLMNQVASVSEDAVAKGYEKALQHKNRLLEFDRTSVKRTQVIDDESDYFSTDSNQWLKDSEKAALRKREEELRGVRHASRKDRKVTLTLDFAGRQVIEEERGVDTYNANDSLVQKINFSVSSDDRSSVSGAPASNVNENIVNPDINRLPPKFISENSEQRSKTTAKPSRLEDDGRKVVRVQDGDLEQMSDSGMALSMHQPWASLLVSGIKRHEGRTWYTQHRGTLWIAATAKTPTQDEIDHVENQYRTYYKYDANLVFPENYPTGCLLGCVEVKDCLAQEDYIEQHPDGESESPYVFVCENARELRFKLPMKGKHKIYKLESHLHKAAKKGVFGFANSLSSQTKCAV